MSLIQEALRRKEADTAGLPPPLASPPPKKPPQKKASAMKAVVAALVLLVLLIGIAVYLFTYLVNSFAPKKSAHAPLTAAVEPPVAAPLQVALEEPAPVPAKAIPAAAVAAVPPPIPKPRQIVVEEPAPVPVKAMPVVEVAPPPAPALLFAKAPVAPEVIETEGMLPVPTLVDKPKSAEWPNLNLMGVVQKGGREGGVSAAMISGELVSINETIQGVRLLIVESSGVWLEMNGEQKFLTVGRSLK